MNPWLNPALQRTRHNAKVWSSRVVWGQAAELGPLGGVKSVTCTAI